MHLPPLSKPDLVDADWSTKLVVFCYPLMLHRLSAETRAGLSGARSSAIAFQINILNIK